MAIAAPNPEQRYRYVSPSALVDDGDRLRLRLATSGGPAANPRIFRGCDRPIRWAASLADVGARSNDHAAVVAEAVARVLPTLANRPSGKLVPLLRLLDELLAGSGGRRPSEAGPVLERLAGAGGHAGRLARSIIARG